MYHFTSSLFLTLPPHKFPIYCRTECPRDLATFSPSSQFSFADSVRSPRQYFSSSFRAHSNFISRAMISSRTSSLSSSLSLSLSRFSPRHYFLAAVPSWSPPLPYSRPVLARCSVSARCNARPISRYPLTCRRFFTSRDTFHPTAHALPSYCPKDTGIA